MTTKECDASEAYKESYIKACKEDIVITQSPVGMPGRAILNPFLSQIKEGIRPAIKSCFQCLEKCDIRTIPYCITQALVNAATGEWITPCCSAEAMPTGRSGWRLWMR